MDNQRFFYAIILLAKIIYANEEHPFETMFSEMLMDRMNSGGQMAGRVPLIDEDTYDILSEPAIKVYIAYNNQLRSAFSSYLH